MAVSCRGGSPSPRRSTSRSLVNGKASTTWSAATSWAAPPQENVHVYRPWPRLRTASRRCPRWMAPVGSLPMTSEMSWSLPPRTCHFSSVPDSCGLDRGWLPLGALS